MWINELDILSSEYKKYQTDREQRATGDTKKKMKKKKK